MKIIPRAAARLVLDAAFSKLERDARGALRTLQKGLAPFGIQAVAPLLETATHEADSVYADLLANTLRNADRARVTALCMALGYDGLYLAREKRAETHAPLLAMLPAQTGLAHALRAAQQNGSAAALISAGPLPFSACCDACAEVSLACCLCCDAPLMPRTVSRLRTLPHVLVLIAAGDTHNATLLRRAQCLFGTYGDYTTAAEAERLCFSAAALGAPLLFLRPTPAVQASARAEVNALCERLIKEQHLAVVPFTL